MNRERLLQRARTFQALERVAFRRIDEAAVRTFAASIAYHAILALVSFTAVVLFLVQVAAGEQALGSRSDLLPEDLERAATTQAERIAELGSSGVIVLTAIGVSLGLLGLASGFTALFDALNRIHGTHRYASMAARYGRALLVSLCFTASFSVALVVVASSTAAGTAFFEALGLPRIGAIASGFVVTLTVLVLVPVTFAMLLRYGSRARPAWRECIAAGTVSGWGTLLFALAFLAFVAVAEPYRGYGAMGSALAILVFAYWASYLLLSSVIFADVYTDRLHVLPGRAYRAWLARDRSLSWRERLHAARARRRRKGTSDG